MYILDNVRYTNLRVIFFDLEKNCNTRWRKASKQRQIYMTRLSSVVREIINDYHRQFGEQGLPGVRLVKPGDTSA